MVTACIHGNEPLSAGVLMACMGRLVSSYGRDGALTELLDSRTIYFVPVVSPDSYPHSRLVDGVDPNRNFPTTRSPDRKSVPPVENLREFFLKVRPRAVLSGHTFGRTYLVPWGDSRKDNPSKADYERVASEMGSMSGYGHSRVCDLYGAPIFGTEADWYHRNGAFAMVMEMGTHQRKATRVEVESEADRVFGAVVHFVRVAAEVETNDRQQIARSPNPLPSP